MIHIVHLANLTTPRAKTNDWPHTSRMALVRDPFFWQRFSRAVHLDEEIRSTTEEKEQSYVSQRKISVQYTVTNVFIMQR